MQSNKFSILGLDLQQWDELAGCENTDKALSYLDGNLEKEVIKALNNGSKGRKNWAQRGFIPRFRQLVRPIVTKSGMLFNDEQPILEVYSFGSVEVNERDTKVLNDELSKIDFNEFLINLDETVRLLKSVLVLTQYDQEEKQLHLTLLHKDNSGVVTDTKGKIIGLIYETADDQYRIYTETEIYDITEDERDNLFVTAVQPNPYGIVPVTPFYDTNKPRCGIWNTPGMDLVNINETYNLHLTDMEWAMSWSKQPTLFTNCRFEPDAASNNLEVSEVYGSALPRLAPSQDGVIGGPNKAVFLTSNGVDSPFAEYKAPVFDAKMLDDVVQYWTKMIAEDWSVRIDNVGTATSGFQLLVQELPNKELRKLRSKCFTAGLKKWYKQVVAILNTAGYNLDPTGELYVELDRPALPVDEETNEKMWDIRINSGRASIIDYLIETKGITKEEAIAMKAEIDQFNADTVVSTELPPEEPTVVTDGESTV